MDTAEHAGTSMNLDDALANAADYGYCASHSRRFYGLRLHTLSTTLECATPSCAMSPDQPERDRARRLTADARARQTASVGVSRRDRPQRAMPRFEFTGPGRQPERHDLPVRVAKHEPDSAAGRALAPIRQRIESIFWTFEDLRAVERHGAPNAPRTPLQGSQAELLTLAAAIASNHSRGRPSRQLADLIRLGRGLSRD